MQRSSLLTYFLLKEKLPASVAQLDARPTGD